MPRRPSKEPPSEHELWLIEQLAHLRWGPTGFCCRCCGHLHAWTLRSRPRVRECRSCGAMSSVTAGTLLHGTRLPIEVWVTRGAQLESSVRVPTVTELCTRFDIARSTAWLLNQKMFALLDFAGTTPPPAEAMMVRTVRIRPPRPTPPMAEAAPKHVRHLHRNHLERRMHRVTVEIVMRLAGFTVSVDKVAATREEVVEAQLRPPGRLLAYHHYGLTRWLQAALVHNTHTVSLRWLPRWLCSALAGWNIAQSGVYPPPWDETAIRCGPRPLKALDPWKQGVLT